LWSEEAGGIDPVKNSHLAAVALAAGLTTATLVGAQIQIRREGPPPRPFDRSEM